MNVLNDASGSSNRLASESLDVGTVLKNRVGIFIKIKLEETYAPLANPKAWTYVQTIPQLETYVLAVNLTRLF